MSSQLLQLTDGNKISIIQSTVKELFYIFLCFELGFKFMNNINKKQKQFRYNLLRVKLVFNSIKINSSEVYRIINLQNFATDFNAKR